MKYFWLEFKEIPIGERTNTFVIRADNFEAAWWINEFAFDHYGEKCEEIKVCNEHFRLILESLCYTNDIADILQGE